MTLVSIEITHCSVTGARLAQDHVSPRVLVQCPYGPIPAERGDSLSSGRVLSRSTTNRTTQPFRGLTQPVLVRFSRRRRPRTRCPRCPVQGGQRDPDHGPASVPRRSVCSVCTLRVLRDTIEFYELVNRHRSSVELIDSVLKLVKHCVRRSGCIESFSSMNGGVERCRASMSRILNSSPGDLPEVLR